MKASVIKIGNSRGVRIPKKLLEETGLDDVVELHTDGAMLVISPAKKTTPALNEEYLVSLDGLKEWARPEEDEAWAYLQ